MSENSVTNTVLCFQSEKYDSSEDFCPSYFVIPDNEITKEKRELLHQANGKLINVDKMNEGMKYVACAIGIFERKYYLEEEMQLLPYYEELLKYRVRSLLMNPMVVSNIIYTGIV